MEEEESRDKDDNENVYEGMTTFREDIDGSDNDVEQDANVSDGYEDVNWDTVWGGGGYKAENWESGGSVREKDKDFIETEDAPEEE